MKKDIFKDVFQGIGADTERHRTKIAILSMIAGYLTGILLKIYSTSTNKHQRKLKLEDQQNNQQEEGGDTLKDQETRQKFIKLRAEGLSFAKIAQELDISKATCSEWQKQYEKNIAKLQKDQLEELYRSYGMLKSQRIASLGSTLQKIDNAIQEADFSSVDPAKLLEIKLKYQDALKGEYIPTSDHTNSEKLDSDKILDQISNLIQRIQTGEISDKEAGIELKALSTALSVYDKTVLEDKLESLKKALEG